MDVVFDYLAPFLVLLIGSIALLIASLAWQLRQLSRTFRDQTSLQGPDGERGRAEGSARHPPHDLIED